MLPDLNGATARIGCRWRSVVAGLALVMVGEIRPALATEERAAAACERAGLDAERGADLPLGLLSAIGVVESGRRDPVTGRVAAWPWTINANGVGRQFDSLEEALAEARSLQKRGVISLDVGCFQINLMHHPAAFVSLEEAFDPPANAAYAARFLLALRTRTGSWQSAIAAYHSATPELGRVYLDSVMASLTQAGLTVDRPAPPLNRVVIWSPERVAGAIRIWKPSTAGLAPSVISIRLPSGGSGTNLPAITVGMGPR